MKSLPIIPQIACFMAAMLLAAMPAHAEERSLNPDAASKGSPRYQTAVKSFFSGTESKIINGMPAAQGQFPWQVSLGISWITDPYKAHFCGGTIYSAKWIVTAAHCLEDTDPKDVAISAGSVKLGNGDVRRNVARIILKKSYDPKTSDNDVALIELLHPLPIQGDILALALLTASEEAQALKPDMTLTTIGWGATNEGGHTVRDLRWVRVPYAEREDCNRPLGYNGRVTENMLCAGNMAGGVDSCQGDSGGPLTVSFSGGTKLAGIVSWGDGCARPNRLGIYSRVSKYADWIKQCAEEGKGCND